MNVEPDTSQRVAQLQGVRLFQTAQHTEKDLSAELATVILVATARKPFELEQCMALEIFSNWS